MRIRTAFAKVRPLLAFFAVALLIGCSASQPATLEPLPELLDKPQPVEVTFQGCPPDGDGGDPTLNGLKNRVDEAKYFPVSFKAISQLPWPKAIERQHRADWSTKDIATVARYEGIPVVVEGYLTEAREEGPEATNCHGADHQFRDFHLWLTESPGKGRSTAIVIEVTPRVRVMHPGWRLGAFSQLAHDNERVRVSGWLMLDPDHPDQVRKTRGTIWEIHPVMEVEVEQQGRWLTLDTLSAPR